MLVMKSEFLFFLPPGALGGERLEIPNIYQVRLMLVPCFKIVYVEFRPVYIIDRTTIAFPESASRMN